MAFYFNIYLKSLFKKITSQFPNDLIFYGIGQAFNLLTPLLVVPYIIKTCGLDNFGKTSTALAFAFFVIVIVDFGVDIIGVKEVSTNRHNEKMLRKILATTFSARLIILLILSILLSIIFFRIPFFSEEKELFLLTLFILLGQYLNPTWFLQGIENFKLITWLNIISKIVYLILIYVFIKQPSDYIYVNLFWALGMIIPFSIGSYYCFRKYQLDKDDFGLNEILNYLKEGYHFCISQLFLSFKYYSPILLISYLGGYNTAGFYKVIEQIITLFRTYLQVVFRFFYPKICYLISKNQREGIDFWKKVNIVNLFLVLIGGLGIFVLSNQVLHFFNVKNQDVNQMDKLLSFSLFIPVFIVISYALEQLLFSLEKRKYYINVTIISVLFGFLLMYLLFTSFQLKGLLIALMVIELSIILAYSVYLYRIFKKQSK